MDYKKLIAEAWEYTQENKKMIRWFGFFPSIFTTIYGAAYITYQVFAFKTSPLFDDSKNSFFHDVIVFIIDFIRAHFSWTPMLIILALFFGVMLFLLPTLTKAAAIQKIARNRNGQKAGVGAGLKYGLLSFLPLLEYHTLIKTFSLFMILGEMSFAIRNLGVSAFSFLLPIFIIFMLISFVLTLVFTYSDFFIVVDGEGVFDSMTKSAKLVVTNWAHTFLITILMLIIGVRIIIQALIVFSIPFLVLLISGYMATVAIPSIVIIVGGILGGILLLISSYLVGVVDIFAYAVWTYTFLDLSAQGEISARDSEDVFSDNITENIELGAENHKNL